MTLNIEQAYTFIDEKVAEYWEALSYIIPSLGDKPPVKIVNKPTKYAGFAYYRDEVEFNLAYFISHPSLAELAEIVAHELCHIVQYRHAPFSKQAHGPEFRYYMQCIGFSGRTYHTMSVAKAKQVAKNNFNLLMDVEI